MESFDLIAECLYHCDHEKFLELLLETWQNRWLPAQVNLSADWACVSQLNKYDLRFYKFLFVFLSLAERLVNFDIDELLKEFKGHNITHYYTEQKAMENIHGQVYANILNVLFNNNQSDLLEYAQSILHDPALVSKIDWLHQRVKNAETTAKKVLMFLLVEGMFFISSFYSIGLLRARHLLPGACQANDYISRDELLHTRAAAELFNSMIPAEEKPSTEWIHALFKEAVEVEYKFIRAKSEGVSLVNPEEILVFLQATADRILQSISLPIIYGSVPVASSPLIYIGSRRHVNFFERENTDYSTSVENDL